MFLLKLKLILLQDQLSLSLFNREVFYLIKLTEFAKVLAQKNIDYQQIKTKFSTKSNKFKIISQTLNNYMLWQKRT